AAASPGVLRLPGLSAGAVPGVGACLRGGALAARLPRIDATGARARRRVHPGVLPRLSSKRRPRMFVAAHNGARIWGGAERATVRLLAGLQQRGHRVLLLCNDPRVMAEAERSGIPTRRLHLGGDLAVVDALRLAATLRRDRPDAFVVGTYKKLFHAALGARLAGVPRVIARVGLETDTPRSGKYRVALRRWVD